MNKALTGLKIVLPFLIVMPIVLILMFFTVSPQAGDGTLEEGLQVVFGFLFSIIPLFCLFPISAALLVIEICLFAVKPKKGSVIAALVFLCLQAPVLGLFSFFTLAMLSEVIVYVIIAVATLAVYLAAFVLCCVSVRAVCKK